MNERIASRVLCSLMVFLLLLPACGNGGDPRSGLRPLILAHRGSTRFAPENSVKAIEEAMADGADGVEIDLRICGSGEVVVFHDRDLKRMTGEEGRVEEKPLVALKKVCLRSPGGGIHRIPTLEEILDRFGGRTILFLEMKVPENRNLAVSMAEKVARAIHCRELEDDTFVSSLNHLFVAQVAKRYHGIRTVYEFLADPELEKMPETLPGNPPHVRWVGPSLSRLNRPFVSWARRRFEGISTFTAVNAGDLDRARSLGADLIQTDIPRVAVLWRDRKLTPEALDACRELDLGVDVPATFSPGRHRLPWVEVPVTPGGVYAVQMEVEGVGQPPPTPSTHGLLILLERETPSSNQRGVADAAEVAGLLSARPHGMVQQYDAENGRYRLTLIHRSCAATRFFRLVFGLTGCEKGFHVRTLNFRVLEES